MHRILLIALMLATPLLAQVAPSRPAGRSPIPQEGETIAKPIPAKRLDGGGEAAATANAGDVVPWVRGGEFVGREITVRGRVVETRDIGNLTFLNFTDRGGSAFYAVVFKEAYGSFPKPPAEHFLNQTVLVTGKVVEHKGRAQIQVRNASQIRIDDGKAGASTGTATAAGGILPWSEAASKVGQRVTVEGRVHGTRDVGNLTFVNFSSDRSAFYVVVFKDTYASFPEPPATDLRGKTIRVTGEVTERKGRAQMEVRDAGAVTTVE